MAKKKRQPPAPAARGGTGLQFRYILLVGVAAIAIGAYFHVQAQASPRSAPRPARAERPAPGNQVGWPLTATLSPRHVVTLPHRRVATGPARQPAAFRGVAVSQGGGRAGGCHSVTALSQVLDAVPAAVADAELLNADPPV